MSKKPKLQIILPDECFNKIRQRQTHMQGLFLSCLSASLKQLCTNLWETKKALPEFILSPVGPPSMHKAHEANGGAVNSYLH